MQEQTSQYVRKLIYNWYLCFFKISFFPFSFYTNFCIIEFINFSIQGDDMADIDAKQLAGRIDTVLDILVAGDYHSAIHNLEILKDELLALDAAGQISPQGAPKTPWEI